jgi:hypothetical protein
MDPINWMLRALAYMLLIAILLAVGAEIAGLRMWGIHGF